jgi:hypothetical protein
MTSGTLKAEVGINSFTATATKMKQLCTKPRKFGSFWIIMSYLQYSYTLL